MTTPLSYLTLASTGATNSMEDAAAHSQYSAHISMAELASASDYFQDLFDSMEHDDSADLKHLHVPTTCSQPRLHALVEALYRKSLLIEPSSAEELLRLAHHLGIRCIVDACAGYIIKNIVPELPLQVLPF